jgi:predicted amidohydrolase YtcJ
MTGPVVDRVFVNGDVLCSSEDYERSEALASSRGRVIAVGSNQRILGLAQTGTEVVDLGGRFVTPGLTDTHTHLASYGLRSTVEVDFTNSPGITAAQAAGRIRQATTEQEAGSWIMAGGWIETDFLDRPLTRQDLDEVAPDHPVIFVHRSGHFLLANGLALAKAEIRPETPSPPGGSIERDGHGRPTGILTELSAMRLITRHLPEPSPEQLERAILWAQSRYLEEGVTSIKETYGDREYSVVVQAYRQLHRRGALAIRPTVLRQLTSVSEAREAVNHLSDADGVRERGIKLFLDGSLVARTAWLSAAYDAPDRRGAEWAGRPALDLDSLDHVVQLAAETDCDIAIHAIGDRAVDVAVSTFLSHAPRSGTQAVRSIVHALMLSRETVAAIARANLAVETQPVFLATLGSGYRNAIGGQRLAALIPLQTLLGAGITVGSGSDMPTGLVGPRHGIWAACARPSPPGSGAEVFSHAERLRPDQALATYLHLAARCLGAEGTIGTLREGACCDLVAWDGSFLESSVDALAGIRPDFTVVGGNVVWQRVA